MAASFAGCLLELKSEYAEFFSNSELSGDGPLRLAGPSRACWSDRNSNQEIRADFQHVQFQIIDPQEAEEIEQQEFEVPWPEGH